MAGKGGRIEGAGRKKGSVNKIKKKIQELAEPYGEKALEVLANLMISGEAESTRIAAAKEILDRAYGKAPQAITGEDGGVLKVSFEIFKA